jgi:hypothetical protein
MTAFNDFSEITFIDGASPPINAANLNALEGVVNLADKELARSASFKLKEYLKYFRQRNTKDIDTFQSNYSDYLNYDPTGTLSNDSVYGGDAFLGERGLKSLIPIATANYFDFAHNIDALNLTEFLDESASSTDDFIFIMFYISDIAAYSGGYLYLNIGDTSISSTYEYDFEVDAWGFDTGWNVAWAPKSDFYVWSGSPNWNNIDFWQIQMDYNAGYQNEYIVLQYMQMVRHDPDDSDYFNPFQKYFGVASGWENQFSQSFPVWTVVDDVGQQVQKLGIIKLNPDNFETPFTPGYYKNGMLIYENVNCFVAKFEWTCKLQDGLPSMTFYIDSTHYAEVYASTSELVLSVANGGAAVNTTYPFDTIIEFNNKIIIFFEKYNDSIRVLGYKNGENLAICEYETTFTSPGDIYLGVAETAFGLLVDFAISNSMNQLHLVNETRPTIIKKVSNQTLSSNTTLQNDEYLWAYLRADQVYEVYLHLSARCVSTTPDLKVAWQLVNTTLLSYRGNVGPAQSNTDSKDTNMKSALYHDADAVAYGLAASGSQPTFIEERFLVRASPTGGLIRLQWSQYTSNASAITVYASGSYIKLTPVDVSTS